MENTYTHTQVLDMLCKYVYDNWYASLGFGIEKDKECIKENTYIFDWVLEFLKMGDEEFIDYFIEGIYNKEGHFLWSKSKWRKAMN